MPPICQARLYPVKKHFALRQCIREHVNFKPWMLQVLLGRGPPSYPSPLSQNHGFRGNSVDSDCRKLCCVSICSLQHLRIVSHSSTCIQIFWQACWSIICPFRVAIGKSGVLARTAKNCFTWRKSQCRQWSDSSPWGEKGDTLETSFALSREDFCSTGMSWSLLSLPDRICWASGLGVLGVWSASCWPFGIVKVEGLARVSVAPMEQKLRMDNSCYSCNSSYSSFERVFSHFAYRIISLYTQVKVDENIYQQHVLWCQ